MVSMFNLPHYKTVLYKINQQTGYYTKVEIQPENVPVMRLPFELRRSPTQAENIKCNASELIVSRERNKSGNYKFITGIQETQFENWYLGNDYQMLSGIKVISIILFHFSKDNSGLSVYYFSRYDKGKTQLRLMFANSIIPELENMAIVRQSY